MVTVIDFLFKLTDAYFNQDFYRLILAPGRRMKAQMMIVHFLKTFGNSHRVLILDNKHLGQLVHVACKPPHP